MGMSRCYSLMKCLLIIFNIIFLCVGGGACGFAAWALWDGRSNESSAARAGLLAVGAWGGALALGALAALGGAARGSAPLLAAALSLLALTAVGEAAAAWWGAAHGPQLRRALLEALDHSVRHEYGVLHTRTQLLDVIQQGLECCGAEGPRDWQHSAWARAQERAAGERQTAAGERQQTAGEQQQAAGERQQAAGDRQQAAGARQQAADASEEAAGALDLSVGAPGTYYWVPPSCCVVNSADSAAAAGDHQCAAARRVAAAPGGGAGLHGAACGARLLAALARLARGPLALAGALLALHALALPLAAALWLRAQPSPAYKA